MASRANVVVQIFYAIDITCLCCSAFDPPQSGCLRRYSHDNPARREIIRMENDTMPSGSTRSASYASEADSDFHRYREVLGTRVRTGQSMHSGRARLVVYFE